MRLMRRSVRVLGVLALTNCGGGTDEGPVTPPPPTPVATVEVTPPTAQVTVGGTSQLAATTKDAAGTTLAGRAVTWSSSDQGIASVSSAGLVTGVGAGQVTVTATSDAKSGTAAVTVVLANFQPSAATSIQGAQRFARVTIPQGVTVTASGALTLRAEDSLVVRGTLTGNCVPMTLIGATVVIDGDVRNGCTVDPLTDDPPVLRIISGSTIEIGTGVSESSGDIVITNDTTLTDADFPASPAGRIGARVSGGNAIVRGNCTMRGRTFRQTSRPAGTAGQFGGTGRNGRTLFLDCAGDLLIANGAIIQAQHGGDGGAGAHSHINTAISTGGGGGTGGNVRVRVLGQLTVGGIGNEIRTGDGGDGGSSTSTGLVNPVSARAASATATGGTAGPPGLATVLAGGGITSTGGGGGLTIVVGSGGSGGAATANAPNGLSATARAGPAQHGGNAIATGGAGGPTPDKKLNAAGAVSLNVGVTGGKAGDGGAATAHAGRGGDGDEANPPGAEGGRLETVGGNGANAAVRNTLGALVGDGGAGGLATGQNADGGHGWSDCVPGQPRKPGGSGGRAGDVFGRGGAGGAGRGNGAASMVEAPNVSRGGNGGRGQGPGAFGPKGVNNIQGTANVMGSFANGDLGMGCSGPPLALIGGLYRLNATLFSLIGACPTGFFLPTINNPGPIAVTTTAAGQVRIQSNFLVSGIMNSDGSWSGSGSGSLVIDGITRTTLELIRGTWEETGGGGVRLNTAGELEFRLFGGPGMCTALYKPATYTKLP